MKKAGYLFTDNSGDSWLHTPTTSIDVSINNPKYVYKQPAGGGNHILTCETNHRPNIVRRALQWIVSGNTWEKNPNYKEE